MYIHDIFVFFQNLSRKTTVEDINGVSMPAITIFALSIRYLRGHFLDALNKQVARYRWFTP